MQKFEAVIGLGYGDEGKGKVVDLLSGEAIKNSLPIVVRYSGGSQAGHTVVRSDGTRHIFNSLGSGTFRNIPTYWASTFLINPTRVVEEIGRLYQHNYFSLPKKSIKTNYLNQIVTPYDIILNKLTELSRTGRHGSCGQGIHETKLRVANGLSLTLKDCMNSVVLYNKLYCVKQYFINTMRSRNLDFFQTEELKKELDFLLENFENDLNLLLNEYLDKFNKNDYNHFILESSQGILLDEIHGFFPYVTHSKVGLEGIKDIWKEISESTQVNSLKIWGITRAYTTRHGAGPLYQEEEKFVEKYLKEKDKTNCYNDWQQNFRYAPLNLELLKYAIEKIKIYKSTDGVPAINLVINHLDQICYKEYYPSDNILNMAQNIYLSLGDNEKLQLIDNKSVNRTLKKY